MAEINAKDVMKLRDRTGCSMMECKKALVEAAGDMEKAEDILRKQMKGKMEKRADRAAGEGRIAIAMAADGKAASIVELKAETDFTARNDNFIATAQKLAEHALKAAAGAVPATAEMTVLIDHIRATTGENISLGRAAKVAAAAGQSFGSYIHHDGKTGVLLLAQGDVKPETLKQVGMHVTAAVPRPAGVRPEDVPAEVVEKERRFRIEQAMESGKPKEIAEKMVEGGMKKFFAEIALLQQPFVVDPTKTVEEIVKPGTIVSFHRWEVGEGAAD